MKELYLAPSTNQENDVNESHSYQTENQHTDLIGLLKEESSKLQSLK
jgi:hypothetical protein